MIDARIQIEVPYDPDQPPTELEELQAASLIDQARAIADESGKTVVKVEVEYPSEIIEGTWDVSGDAVSVDFSVEPPLVAYLPPYDEVAP